MIILLGPNGERQIPENTPYRLLPGEKVIRGTGRYGTIRESELDKLAESNKVGLGDLVASITTSTGFKNWWDEKHGGECAPCKQRQATLNYIKFQGPKWLAGWIKKGKEK